MPFFVSVFIGHTCSKPLHTTAEERGKKEVRDYLVKLNVFTPMKLDEIHPSALMELSDVTVRLLLVIYKKT